MRRVQTEDHTTVWSCLPCRGVWLTAEEGQVVPPPNLSLPIPRYCPVCDDQILAELYYRGESGEFTVEHCRSCLGAWVSQAHLNLWQRLLHPHRTVEAPAPAPETAPAADAVAAESASKAAPAAAPARARPAASPAPTAGSRPVEEPPASRQQTTSPTSGTGSGARFSPRLILAAVAILGLFLVVRLRQTDGGAGTGQRVADAGRQAHARHDTKAAASRQPAANPAEEERDDEAEEEAAAEITPTAVDEANDDRVRRGEITTIEITNASARDGVFFLPEEPTDRAIPLLVLLHDTGGSGRQIAEKLTSLANQRGFAVLAPDSGLSQDGTPVWATGDGADETTEDYKHVMACVSELQDMDGVFIDSMQVLIAGYGGGGAAALGISSHESLFSAFAVMHGTIEPEGLGSNGIRGWLSTGSKDDSRPPERVRSDVARLEEEGYSDLELHEFGGGHELTAKELEELVRWWLGD